MGDTPVLFRRMLWSMRLYSFVGLILRLNGIFPVHSARCRPDPAFERDFSRSFCSLSARSPLLNGKFPVHSAPRPPDPAFSLSADVRAEEVVS